MLPNERELDNVHLDSLLERPSVTVTALLSRPLQHFNPDTVGLLWEVCLISQARYSLDHKPLELGCGTGRSCGRM